MRRGHNLLGTWDENVVAGPNALGLPGRSPTPTEEEEQQQQQQQQQLRAGGPPTGKGLSAAELVFVVVHPGCSTTQGNHVHTLFYAQCSMYIQSIPAAASHHLPPPCPRVSGARLSGRHSAGSFLGASRASYSWRLGQVVERLSIYPIIRDYGNCYGD